MKFHQLPLGARFEFQGERYRKSAPLLATAETSGTQRVIPRSAVISPLESPALEPATSEGGTTVAAETVRSALDRYHAACVEALSVCVQGAPPEHARALLEEARSDFCLQVFGDQATP